MLMPGEGWTRSQETRQERRRLWRLSVVKQTADREAILLLDGRIWHTTAADLDRLARQVLSEGVQTLVLDLSRVDYLNGAAVGTIERLSVEMTARGGRLALRNPAAPVRVALELSGILVPLIEPTAP
jgi:anti-anti-sigma factor